MLGSVANNLFWMARYLERSENSSRLLEMGIRRNLSERDNSSEVWEEILSLLGQKSPYDNSGNNYEQLSVTNFILRDKENTASVWSLVNQSRKNARTVRGSLTRDVWQAINDLWLYLQTALKSPVGSNDLPVILAKIQQGNALVRGALEGSMLRNDIYNFLKAGTFIERGDNTARIIAANYYLFLPSAILVHEDKSVAKLEAVLAAAGAMRAYKWLYKGNLDPASIILFLVADKRTPRSLNYSYHELVSQLQALTSAYDTPFNSLTIANKIKNAVDYKVTGTKRLGDLQEFINSFVQQNSELSECIEKEFKFNRA
jgi:uncharacterized alpha-E superfamily protein